MDECIDKRLAARIWRDLFRRELVDILEGSELSVGALVMSQVANSSLRVDEMTDLRVVDASISRLLRRLTCQLLRMDGSVGG